MAQKVALHKRAWGGFRRRVLSKDRVAQIRAELVRDVGRGDMVEKFLRSPEWRAIISPWLRKQRDDNLSGLANVQRTHPDDIAGYFEAGQIRMVFLLRHMLSETIAKQRVAIQKLEALQEKQEKQNG